MVSDREPPPGSSNSGEIIIKQLILQNLNAKRPASDQDGQKHTSPMPIPQQPRFAQAVHYAKESIHDPEYIAAAQAYTDRSAFSIAHRDFMHPPKIIGINLRRYTGTTGDSITVIAVDDFKVTKVTFELIIAETVVESGPAKLLADGLTWRYITATTTRASQVKIVCGAYDKAANRTQMVETVTFQSTT